MRFVLWLFCCIALFQVGCSQTAPRASSNTQMQSAPAVETITIAAKKGRTYGIIRLAADSKSPILAKPPVGTEMRSFGQVDDWYQVQIPETGQLGWINDVFLELEKVP